VADALTTRRDWTIRWRLLIAMLLGALALALPSTAVAVETASISGHVTVASTGVPIAEVTVCALKVGGGGIRCVGTGPKGEYTITGLEVGSWNVQFDTEKVGMGLLEMSYERNPVVLGAGTHAEGVDAALRSGGEIAGTVRNAGTGEPLAGIVVCLVPSPGKGSPHCTESAVDGTYDFESLASGTYKVAFSPEGEEIWGALVKEAEEETGEVLFPVDGYSTLWWSSGASASTATPIQLTAPQTVGGIDGSISAPAPWTIVSQGSSTPESIPVAPVVFTPNAFIPPMPTTTGARVTRPAKKRKPLECRRGFVKRKAHGKATCVRRPKAVRHAKKKHPKHAA
jgi:hypothetical protein